MKKRQQLEKEIEEFNKEGEYDKRRVAQAELQTLNQVCEEIEKFFAKRCVTENVPNLDDKIKQMYKWDDKAILFGGGHEFTLKDLKELLNKF